MAANFGLRLLLALVSCSTIAGIAHGAPTVHFISNMPKESPALSIDCRVNGATLVGHPLKVGEDYQWSATANDIYYCATSWGRLFASWHGYEPTRDAGRPAIFWRVEEDGFFLSWDKSVWKKEADWETE